MSAVNPLVQDTFTQAPAQDSPAPGARSGGDLQPLLPGSQTWRDFGTLMFHLMLPQAFTLQVAHPMVDTAVGVDKKYKHDPYGRAKNSTRLLWPVVYSRPQQAVQMGINLRELHRKIKGVDSKGNKYHALDPEAYSWVHVTGFDTTVRAHDYFGKPLNEAERAEAFREWQMMGRLLGVAEKYIFATEEEYWQHFNYIIDERLKSGEVLADLLNPNFMLGFPKHPAVTWLPDFIWKPMMKIAGHVQYALVAETLPERAKRKFNINQSWLDKLIFKAIQWQVKLFYPLLPERVRYIPLAWEAIQDSRKHPEAYVWDK